MQSIGKTCGRTTARRFKRAFTLVEVMLSIFVFLLVMAGVLSVMLSTTRAINATSEAADADGRLRLVQERLLFDLRSTESVTDLKKKDTVTINEDSETVYREFSARIFSRGAALDAASVPVTYRFEGDSIVRIDAGHPAGVPVLSGISDAWFQFYNRKGTDKENLTDDKSLVTAIRVSFVPKKSRFAASFWTQPSSSALVQLRNPTFK